jgi:16S rRNA (cytosine967-C5)-methyltransferase
MVAGMVSAQDISQGLVASIVNPQPGEEILDFCSAPGGKTGHLAELAPEALIFATDKAEERLELVREMVQRNGYENVKIVAYDDIVSSKKKFDAILVDAPCSGTGVLARRPDLRWRRSPDDIKRMSSVQLSLLNYAADRLKAKGRIIYSTCSVEPEENDGVIDRFLEERSDFENIPISGLPESITTDSPRLQLWGTEIKADGVFAAIIRKK